MYELESDMGVTVVIAAKGAEKYLPDCLVGIDKQTVRPEAVIIADDGLAPDVLEKIGQIQVSYELTIVSNAGAGPSDARNLGVEKAATEYVAFIDADCLPETDWLEKLLAVMQARPDAAACGGMQKLPDDATPFERRVAGFMQRVGFLTDYIKGRQEVEAIETDHNASCNVIYRRETLVQVGGFRKGLWPGEDVELDYRLKQAGNKLLYTDRSVVRHHRPESFKSFLKMMWRYGKVQGQLVREYGVFRLIQKLPFLLTGLALVVVALLALLFAVQVCAVIFSVALVVLGVILMVSGGARLLVAGGAAWYLAFWPGLLKGLEK